MQPLPHHYDVHLSGEASGRARLGARGLPVLLMAPPAEYDGPGNFWTPEHLLLASVEACYLFTLRAIARFRNVELGAIEIDASGTVDRENHVTRFTEIVLRVRATIELGVDRERVREVFEKTERACLVSQSLATPVRVEVEWREPRTEPQAA
jgi:uncharacterized OsmC-like protein